MLKTKSFQAKKSRADGLRVCVMRRVKPEYEYDIWLKELSPTEKLLQAYVIDHTMDWKKFTPLFLKQLQKKQHILKLLIEVAEKQTVTLLCWEETSEFCHRSLVAQACARLHPQLKIKED